MSERLMKALEAGTIRVGFEAADLAQAVRDLLSPALFAHNIAADRVDDIVSAVLKREENGTTCSGEVALPHARSADVPTIITGFATNGRAIYDGANVRFMLTFVSPQDAPADHLRFLSEAAKVFRNEALLERLLDAKTAGDVVNVLRNG
jgi:PTS system fructose-specific IIA component/PTS system nitrogen regulatory IIA component